MSSKDGALDQRFVVPVRTDLQISGWEGPEGIRATTRSAKTAGERTILFANPPRWTEQANCLDDWKAFDEVRVSKDAAEGLCSGCPVAGECLSNAMAEEGTLSARFRAGIRGGLRPVDRYELATIDTTCESNHSRREHGHLRKNGFWECRECTRTRLAVLTTCSCGKELPLGQLGMHLRRKGCARHLSPPPTGIRDAIAEKPTTWPARVQEGAHG